MISSLLLLAVIVSSGCAAASKTFSQNGFTITLTEDFTPVNYGAYTAAFQSEEVFLVALEEKFIYFEGNDIGAESSLTEYAQFLINANGIDAKVETDSDLVYYVYEIFDIDTLKPMTAFLAAVYKTEDAFWLLQFAADAEDFEDCKEDILTYAKSVIFE